MSWYDFVRDGGPMGCTYARMHVVSSHLFGNDQAKMDERDRRPTTNRNVGARLFLLESGYLPKCWNPCLHGTTTAAIQHLTRYSSLRYPVYDHHPAYSSHDTRMILVQFFEGSYYRGQRQRMLVSTNASDLFFNRCCGRRS